MTTGVVLLSSCRYREIVRSICKYAGRSHREKNSTTPSLEKSVGAARCENTIYNRPSVPSSSLTCLCEFLGNSNVNTEATYIHKNNYQNTRFYTRRCTSPGAFSLENFNTNQRSTRVSVGLRSVLIILTFEVHFTVRHLDLN